MWRKMTFLNCSVFCQTGRTWARQSRHGIQPWKDVIITIGFSSARSGACANIKAAAPYRARRRETVDILLVPKSEYTATVSLIIVTVAQLGILGRYVALRQTNADARTLTLDSGRGRVAGNGRSDDELDAADRAAAVQTRRPEAVRLQRPIGQKPNGPDQKLGVPRRQIEGNSPKQ